MTQKSDCLHKLAVKENGHTSSLEPLNVFSQAGQSAAQWESGEWTAVLSVRRECGRRGEKEGGREITAAT